MGTPKTISYSSWDRYMTCPKMYEIEKIEGYEPKQKSSALIFGSAIDQALNELLLTNNKDSAVKIFTDGIRPLLKTDEFYFFKGDFDYDLLTEKQITLAEEYLKELEYSGTMDVVTLHSTLYSKILDNGNDYSVISNQQQKFISFISTMSLKQKGLMMIDAYVDKILPQIEKVISVQKATTLRPGFLDLEIVLKGIGKVTADHKTASRMYTQSQIDYAPQLLLYDKEVNNKQIAYIVLGKNVNKNTTKTCCECGFNGNGLRHKTCPDVRDGVRCNGEWDVMICPEIETQILVGDVDTQIQDTVLKSIASVEDAIDKKAFPMNINACANQYGKPCPYIDYCHKGSVNKIQKRNK